MSAPEYFYKYIRSTLLGMALRATDVPSLILGEIDSWSLQQAWIFSEKVTKSNSVPSGQSCHGFCTTVGFHLEIDQQHLFHFHDHHQHQ